MGRANNNGLMKLEALLRFLAFCMLAVAAIVMATDTQTKVFFHILTKTVNFKITDIFISSVYVHSIVAGYTLVQLVRSMSSIKYSRDKSTWSTIILKWVYFLLDQIAVYAVFATNCAASEFSILAIVGAADFQWMKLCNKYARLCFQFGTSVVFGFLASILLAGISGISAFNLFRWYSPNLLSLKPRMMGIV